MKKNLKNLKVQQILSLVMKKIQKTPLKKKAKISFHDRENIFSQSQKKPDPLTKEEEKILREKKIDPVSEEETAADLMNKMLRVPEEKLSVTPLRRANSSPARHEKMHTQYLPNQNLLQKFDVQSLRQNLNKRAWVYAFTSSRPHL